MWPVIQMIMVFYCEQHCYTTHRKAVLCSVCIHIPRFLTGFGSNEQVISWQKYIIYIHYIHQLPFSKLVKCKCWSDAQIQLFIQYHRKNTKTKVKLLDTSTHMCLHCIDQSWGFLIVPWSWVWEYSYKLMVSKVVSAASQAAAYIWHSSTVRWKQALSRVRCYCALPPM